ncbi:MAG: hypothetical protein ACRDS0_35970 [Pseudonocardiaceae bacterium]
MVIVGCRLSCGHQVTHRVLATAVTGTDLTGVTTLWCSRCARRTAVLRCRLGIEGATT